MLHHTTQDHHAGHHCAGVGLALQSGNEKTINANSGNILATAHC
jgi:hypothetical protein